MYRIVKESHPEREDEYVVEASCEVLPNVFEWDKESFWRRHTSLDCAQARVADLIQIDEDRKLTVREIVETFE